MQGSAESSDAANLVALPAPAPHDESMTDSNRAPASAVHGIGRLAIDAVLGLTGVVESMHGTIARKPLPVGTLAETHTRGITRLVYQSIRSVTRLMGGGLDRVLPLIPEPPTTPRRE